jgi:hypothetical protein
MDMATTSNEQQVFFSTGRREEGVDAIDALQLRPAMFSGFRDLTRLRYDFPLVLVRNDKGVGPVRALSAIVDEVLGEIAPRGVEGDRLRRHALRLEREIRARVAGGEAGLLSDLWSAAAAKVGAPSDQDAEEVLRYTADTLKLDGELVDCNAAMPPRFLAHAWEEAHEARARAFRKTVDALVVRLSDILRAAYIHSQAGQQPAALRASMGSPHDDEFDFDAMSRLVARRTPKDELPAPRRKRIEWALEILRTQRFYPDPKGASAQPGGEGYVFRFGDCAAAAAAFRERLATLAETVKAMSVAELEAKGAYDEAHHDAFFEGFGEHTLTPEDLAIFPDYLVCIPPERTGAPENANLMELLSSGLPVKVLVETGDLLEEAAIGVGHFAFGVRSTRLAMTATGLGGVFVIQSPSSNLYRLRSRIAAGLQHRGPALFSVYAGAGAPASGLPPYLTAAAAMQSRACPTFSYDPYAGNNQAARFSFENNPDPDADWSAAEVEYADEQMQRVTEKGAFTFADFVLCDKRYAGHFARVPRTRWNAGMLPVADWLGLDAKEAGNRIPYLLAVDGDDLLHRVIVDARLMQAVRRNLVLWHRLQEQGGIHNSYADRLLAVEKAAWEAQKRREIEALHTAAPAAVSAVAPEAPAAGTASEAPVAVAAEEAPAHSPDEAWIETARCPSCNECQLINDRMFLYNANKQAYIGDLKAGTFKQMVEAAESCQVAIIHPGKPWNDKEPGLAELIERAQPFL